MVNWLKVNFKCHKRPILVTREQNEIITTMAHMFLI